MAAEKRPSARAARAVENVEVQADETMIEAPATENSNDEQSAILEMVPGGAQGGMADVFPDFAISLPEAGRRIKMLGEFVRDHMVEGEDYGVIPGASPKPTLFKPGAEKLNAIFGLAPVVEVSSRVEDWEGSFVAYEIKVTLLNKRSGQIEAEGIGSCNSRERRYKTQDAANIANTILKMAKKRALIDATLSATRASGIFTQDVEDMDFDRSHGAPRSSQGGAQQQRNVPSQQGGYARGGGQAGGNSGGGSALLTEAQRGAILAMANRAFGRGVNEEMAKLLDKPIAQLTKGEASGVIDHLRSLLPEQPQRQGQGEGYNRSQPGR